MKKFDIKFLTLFIVLFLVMAVLPASFADESCPRIVLETDYDYYKAGDIVHVDIMLYDVKAMSVDFCVKFDGDVIAPGENGDATKHGEILSVTDTYDADEKKGIFSYIPKYGLLSDAGEDCYFFSGVYVDPEADEANVKDGKIVAGSEGYQLGTIIFRMLKDGEPALSFGTGIFKDSDGLDYRIFRTAGYDFGDEEDETGEIIYRETPYADARERAHEIRNMIDDLTSTCDDGFDGLEARINEAEAAYDGMSELERKVFTEEYCDVKDVQRKIAEAKERLTAGRTEEEDNDAVAPVKNKVNALRDTYKFTDADELERKINEAEEAFAMLTSHQQEKLKKHFLDLNDTGRIFISYENIISDAKSKVLELRAVDNVESLIKGIGEVTLAKEEVTADARKAYEVLTEDQKTLVNNYDVLEDAEKALSELKSEIEDVINMINSFPQELTPEHAKAVAAARKAYDELAEEQKSLVRNIDKFKAAEALLYEYIAVKDVEDMINELADKATFVTEDDIYAVKESYNALTDGQKAFVANADKLEALLAELENKYALVEDYIAECGDRALIIEDKTGYLDIRTTLADLLTPEDKDFIVDGHTVVYSVSGISYDVSDEPFFSETDIFDGKKPFSTIYGVIVEKGIAAIGEGERSVIGKKQTVSSVPGTITVKFTVPGDMLLSSDQATRTFRAYVGLMAENFDPVWADDLDENAHTITFVTSGSAEFIPVYLDTANPATNDSVAIYVVTFMLIVLTVAIIDRKKVSQK